VTVADVVRDPGKDDDSEGDRHSRSKTVVVLADESSRRFLPIWVGESEGTAIAIGARELSAPRPLTYPFVARLLEAGGVSVREVRVDRLDGNTFYAKVELAGGSSPGEVDARPSDAIALAMQTGAPIYVADEVMESAGFDAPEHAGGDTERGRGLDAIVAEVEEWLKPRDPQHSISQEERDESYRRLLALIFGTDA
jgi:bifunctional DNase/RNase